MATAPPSLLFAGSRLSETRPARLRLRLCGARVLLSDRPDEALRRAVDDAPDVVVFEEDSREAWPPDWPQRLRALRPDVELILLENPGSAGLRSLGLGALYAGPMPISTGMLIGLLEARFPGRLSKPRPRAPARILCVDDDLRWLAGLERSLVRRGYAVDLFDSAPAALRDMKRAAPDAAIVDVMMPGMDGWDLTEAIARETRGKVPVVLLTALGSEDAVHEGHRRGARFFLTKTVEPDRLHDVVDFLAADLDESERTLLQARL